jgi:hypothetical protein
MQQPIQIEVSLIEHMSVCQSLSVCQSVSLVFLVNFLIVQFPHFCSKRIVNLMKQQEGVTRSWLML